MNQIAKMSENIPQPASESAALIHLIERLARDPAADLDKMQKLLEMRERIVAQEALTRFNDAMSAAQSEMTRVSADSSNPQTRSRYASFAAIDRALRPIYTKHGFNISFDTGDEAPENCVRVLAFVAAGGHNRTYHLDMPADGKGARGNDVMTKTHATMSAVTYGRRGLLKMIFNIAEGDDDDGNAAASDTISEKQYEELQSLIVETGTNIQIFCKHYRIDKVQDLPAILFEQAKNALERKAKAKA